MNPREKKILKILQSEFPLDPAPYAAVARRCGVSEAYVLDLVAQFRRKKVIRRIGAVADGKALGYRSTLLGLNVAPRAVARIARLISACSGVTHNYLRDGDYNLWCTYAAKTNTEITRYVRSLKAQRGVRDVLALPAKKTFKINAQFHFD